MKQATTRRDFLRLAAASAGLLGLAACSQPAAAPAATTAPAAGTQAPAKAGSKVTLETWTHFAGANLEFMNKLVAEFQKDNTDIEFKVTSIGAGEINQKFITAAAGGAPPDIYHAPGWVPPDIALSGLLAPLNDIKLPLELFKNFDGITIFNGTRFGLPVNGGLGAMCYNKDLMAAAGVTKAPGTWDELLAASQKMTKASDNQWGIELPNKPGGTATMQTIVSLFSSAGTEILSPDGKEPAFNNEAGLAAFQYGTDLVQKHKVQPVKSFTNNDTWNDYGTGKVGAVNLYPVWLGNIRTFKFKSLCGEMPRQKGPGTNLAGNYWTTPASASKEKFAAFSRWVTWWYDPKRNAQWCKDTGGIPVGQKVIDDPLFQDYVKAESDTIKAYIDSIPYAKPFPAVLGAAAVIDLIATAWESAVLGKTPPKEALAQAEKQAADELKRAQKR
ncbi:MAG: extracellular solute-binding protein [Chloroflexota bacterium]